MRDYLRAHLESEQPELRTNVEKEWTKNGQRHVAGADGDEYKSNIR